MMSIQNRTRYLTVLIAMAVGLSSALTGVTSAAVILHQDDFSTNSLGTDYITLGATYNATPQTVTIARGSGSNYLEISDTFGLDTGESTELTVAFNWAFGTSMFGSGFLVQYNDNVGTGWQTILSQNYSGTNANDSGLAGNFSTVTILESNPLYSFTDDAAVRIIGTANSGSKGYNFDNLAVSVDQFYIPPIPEPSSLVLAALGLLGLIRKRRRRNHRA